jgi:hypothetical protein
MAMIVSAITMPGNASSTSIRRMITPRIGRYQAARMPSVTPTRAASPTLAVEM